MGGQRREVDGGSTAMKNRYRYLAGIALISLLTPSPFACGPFFENVVFTQPARPDDVEAFARGILGIVRPTFHREYLYLAYRSLSGRPFEGKELEAALARYNPEEPASTLAENWVNRWRRIESEILLVKHEPYPDWMGSDGLHRRAPGDQYAQYLNCHADAFRSAVQIFEQRRRAYNESQLKSWVMAQSTVFENCGDYGNLTPAAVVPAPAQDSDPALLRADRAYQIAAAHFYSEQFDKAVQAFDAIAKDRSSPWRELALYLAARALIRKGTLIHPQDSTSNPALQQADQRLRAILGDTTLISLHGASQKLLGFVRFRLAPEERRKELAARLLSSLFVETRQQDLIDYTMSLDRLVGDDNGYGYAEEAAIRKTNFEKAKEPNHDELTDWIVTFQSPGKRALDHAYERWMKTHSEAWLVAAISKVDTTDSRTPRLLDEAAKVPPKSTAFITLAYHRARLLALAGRSDEARAIASQMLAQQTKYLDRSGANAFRAIRMKLARNLSEFLADAASPPAEFDSAPSSAQFDVDAARALTEQLPAAMLAEAASHSQLPAPLRRQIAIAAWTRAVIAGEHPTARNLCDTLKTLVPELEADLKDYCGSSGPQRSFAAAILLLKNPGMRPFVGAAAAHQTLSPRPVQELDQLRDNWWCSPAPAKAEEWRADYYRIFDQLSPQLSEIYPDNKVVLSILSDAQKAAARAEQDVLQRKPAAPTLLAKSVLDFAKAHPTDARVPQALHLAVRATRYGCADSENGKYSKAAFQFLHSRYPRSEWARKTPYWFD